MKSICKYSAGGDYNCLNKDDIKLIESMNNTPSRQWTSCFNRGSMKAGCQSLGHNWKPVAGINSVQCGNGSCCKKGQSKNLCEQSR